MTRYAYVATTPDGGTATGVQKAPSRQAAELALYELELRDIQITERRSPLRFDVAAVRVKREQLMHLTRQLGAFIRAGLPLIEAVRTLGAEAGSSSVRRIMREIEEGLRSGDKLSECMDRHPRVFPEFYRGILRAAELSGQLDSIMEQLARYLERDLEARRKIKAALIYPSMIAGMSLMTVVVLASFVLPRFRTFFDSLHAQLPLPTRMLLAVTEFLTTWWWALAAGLLTAGLLLAAALRTTRGRYAKDSLILKVPALGSTVRFALVERFCRILSSMVGAGVSLPEALRVATGSLHNVVFVNSLARVGDALMEGEGLAQPLAATGLFPPTAAQMMLVGEETGTLDEQLEVTAHYYEGELDYKLKKLIGLFEPAVIIFMGAIVGFVAIALVSAMYGIFHQVKV